MFSISDLFKTSFLGVFFRVFILAPFYFALGFTMALLFDWVIVKPTMVYLSLYDTFIGGF